MSTVENETLQNFLTVVGVVNRSASTYSSASLGAEDEMETIFESSFDLMMLRLLFWQNRRGPTSK
jgi:hypothetical protein